MALYFMGHFARLISHAFLSCKTAPLLTRLTCSRRAFAVEINPQCRRLTVPPQSIVLHLLPLPSSYWLRPTLPHEITVQ